MLALAECWLASLASGLASLYLRKGLHPLTSGMHTDRKTKLGGWGRLDIDCSSMQIYIYNTYRLIYSLHLEQDIRHIKIWQTHIARTDRRIDKKISSVTACEGTLIVRCFYSCDAFRSADFEEIFIFEESTFRFTFYISGKWKTSHLME